MVRKDGEKILSILDQEEGVGSIRESRGEADMKRWSITALAVAAMLGPAAWSTASNLSKAQGIPNVFCQVLKKPDPLLMGSWKCTFERELEEGGRETNPAEYRLVEYEGKYALYFYRTSRGDRKRYMGWREWTINGTQITSDSGVKIFVEKGEVFFSWQNGTPVKMTRIDP
jgi:hypothetical protein